MIQLFKSILFPLFMQFIKEYNITFYPIIYIIVLSTIAFCWLQFLHLI